MTWKLRVPCNQMTWRQNRETESQQPPGQRKLANFITWEQRGDVKSNDRVWPRLTGGEQSAFVRRAEPRDSRSARRPLWESNVVDIWIIPIGLWNTHQSSQCRARTNRLHGEARFLGYLAVVDARPCRLERNGYVQRRWKEKWHIFAQILMWRERQRVVSDVKW